MWCMTHHTLGPLWVFLSCCLVRSPVVWFVPVYIACSVCCYISSRLFPPSSPASDRSRSSTVGACKGETDGFDLLGATKDLHSREIALLVLRYTLQHLHQHFFEILCQ